MTDILEAFNVMGIYMSNYDTYDGYNITLPQIYRNLVLSDFVYSSTNVNNKVMIINLCEQPLHSGKNRLIYNFKLDDSENISYEYFKNIMLNCCNLLKIAETNNLPVIVNCAAGINRSCSVIVAYSFLMRRFPVHQAIEYIKHMKVQKYGNKWPTLTNYKFVEYLQIMQHEFH